MIFGVVMSFYLFFHVRGGRVCVYHEVAAKWSTFDEVLLQIAISQKVFEGFEWNLQSNIPLGKQILLPSLKLPKQWKGCYCIPQTFISCSKSFLAAKSKNFQWNSTHRIPHFPCNILLKFRCLQKITLFPPDGVIPDETFLQIV